MEGNIIKLYKNVNFYDPEVWKNLLNKIPKVYIIKDNSMALTNQD